jgi:hypothetical protein
LYRHDADEAVELVEVIRVARVQGKLRGERGCGDEEIEGAATARLATYGGDRGVDTAVLLIGDRL